MAAAFAYRGKGIGSSDSDSENSDTECLNWKRVTKNEGEKLDEIPIVPPVEPVLEEAPNPQKRKRNNIWSEVLEDQMMSDIVKDCGIKNKPKGYGNRGEESYDFSLGKKYCYEDDGSDEHMSDGSGNRSFKRNKRFKSDKYVEVSQTEKEAAKKIIKVVAEPKTYLIFRIVKYLGVEKAMKLLKMTEDIEENGGLMIKNQERRRTPGGVFLFLLRTDKSIEKETMDKIFEGEINSYERKKKFDELRKKKHKRKQRKSKNSYNPLKIKNSSENSRDSSKDSDVAEMEEDNASAVVDVQDSVGRERTSDLEEGEVE